MLRLISAIAAVVFCVLPSGTVLGAQWLSGCRKQVLPLASGAAHLANISPDLKRDLDALLRDVVAQKVTPSAALLVAHRGRVIYRNAVGQAHVDSIFDLASVTKVVATTTAVMQLIGRGKLTLETRIGRLLPTLPADKRAITVRQLLLHTSGLPSVVYRGELTDGRKVILDRAWRARLKTTPGTARRYSDVGFILLGEVVAAASGMPLDQYARRFIFRPLGMCDSGYAPPKALRSRLVSPWPTYKNPTGANTGVVYDPLGARMGGVAGHAGLFSTLDDLARFGQALLDGGRATAVPSKVLRRFLRPQKVPNYKTPTALGWLIESKHRPQQLSGKAFGHGGFTGTALWIDPIDQLVVVLLTNRTFYEPNRSISPLRRRVHALVNSSLLRPPQRPVRTGLDQLVAARFKSLRGKRLGLVTNRTAVDAKRRWIVDLIDAAGIDIRALFAPEHGLAARVDRRIKDNVYTTRSGRRVKLYSLFGPRRKPTRETLSGIDTMVFDVAAVGVRYYTYISTMALAMEASARQGIEFVVLDRPNPIGAAVAGPVSMDRRRTSTNYHPLPVRYGMTMGELARMFNAERRIKAKLRVVKVQNWSRKTTFDRQGVPWTNPSPNIRSWRQAVLYGAVGLLEGTNLAVGRGTDSPFVWLGAPWIDGAKLADRLNRRRLPGVYFVGEKHRPRASRYKGKDCGGVRLVLLSPSRFRPVRTGLALALVLRAAYPRRWRMEQLYRLVRHPPTVEAIRARRPIEKIVRLWRPGLRGFLRRRARYLLYR